MLDEVKQVGNMVQAAARSAQPYRRHILGLPLQRSLFGQAARAATTIGLPGLASELDFPARLDENGDLFLDRSQITALTKALPSWFTPETLELMHTTHVAACDALVDASENAARVAAPFSDIGLHDGQLHRGSAHSGEHHLWRATAHETDQIAARQCHLQFLLRLPRPEG